MRHERAMAWLVKLRMCQSTWVAILAAVSSMLLVVNGSMMSMFPPPTPPLSWFATHCVRWCSIVQLDVSLDTSSQGSQCCSTAVP